MARKKPAVTLPSDSSPPDRGEAPKARGKGGAPPGNVNASKDKGFTLAMREARRLASRDRRKRHRSHLDAARATVAECGLEDSPLGERIAQRLAQIEHEIEELGRVVERIGRVKRNGELCPPYEKRLALIREDRVELRALVDKLAEIMAAQPKPETEIVYRICNADGSEVRLTCDNDSTPTLPPETAAGDGPNESRPTETQSVRPANTQAPDGAKADHPQKPAADSVAEQTRRALYEWTHADFGD